MRLSFPDIYVNDTKHLGHIRRMYADDKTRRPGASWVATRGILKHNKL